MTTRREFVADAVRCVAGGAVASHVARVIPRTGRTGRTVAAAWLPDPRDADVLRALALQAIDAAREAGATFADIRIGEQHGFRVSDGFPQGRVATEAGYGVRVLIDGTWGIGHGDVLTADAVTTVAREAAAAARVAAAVNTRVRGRRVELAPAPPAMGEWTSPCDVSPFTVPLDDYARVFDSWRYAIEPLYTLHVDAGAAWTGETRVVASSEGTLVTQHLTRCAPFLRVSGGGLLGHRNRDLDVPVLIATSAGFEALMKPEIPDRIRETGEAVLRLAGLPERPFDVTGRFPVVFNGAAVATLLGMSLGQALDGDRVAGFESDAAGRSFVTPSVRAAGSDPLCSSLVTVRADRAAPSYTAVRWDDEGTVPQAVTLIERGHVRALLTTRESASVLDTAGTSIGMAVAPDPTLLVMGGGAHLALTPAATGASLDTLLRGVSRGVLCYGGTCLPEPGLSTGLFRGRMLVEVRQGQPVAHVENDLTFQFQTRRWWSDRLRALGDASTVATTLVRTPKGMPWQEMTQVAAAPAALLADVDVMSTR